MGTSTAQILLMESAHTAIVFVVVGLVLVITVQCGGAHVLHSTGPRGLHAGVVIAWRVMNGGSVSAVFTTGVAGTAVDIA